RSRLHISLKFSNHINCMTWELSTLHKLKNNLPLLFIIKNHVLVSIVRDFVICSIKFEDKISINLSRKSATSATCRSCSGIARTWDRKALIHLEACSGDKQPTA